MFDIHYSLVGEGGGVDKKAELDPTQKLAGTDGRSPAAISMSELFAFIDKQVGLKNTLIVLSSDHGAAAVPAQLNEFGIDAQLFLSFLPETAWPPKQFSVKSRQWTLH